MKSNAQASTITKFRSSVWNYYETNGRNELPWRKTKDPYKILVSEVMLQQTQVERVKPFYENFIKKFSTISELARAPLADVLRAWQGLGYNSRAKRLQDTAREIMKQYGGKMPKEVSALESLPGIGGYTARAVSAFAYNQDAVLVETNTRTAVVHHFFPGRKIVNDKEIREILQRALPPGRSRDWNSALMDYGAHLKRSGIRLNSKRPEYKKQPSFKGSNRQARGAILRALAAQPATAARLSTLLGDNRKEQLRDQLKKLRNERLVQKTGKIYQLSQ